MALYRKAFGDDDDEEDDDDDEELMIRISLVCFCGRWVGVASVLMTPSPAIELATIKTLTNFTAESLLWSFSDKLFGRYIRKNLQNFKQRKTKRKEIGKCKKSGS